MTDSRPAPFFVADHTGLDFLNTIAVPVDVRVEWLASGPDLVAWLRLTRLVPEDALKKFLKNALPGELDAVAAQARALRDWFKLFVYKHMGKPIAPDALSELDPLNQLLVRDAQFGQIVERGRPANREHHRGSEHQEGIALAWSTRRHWHSPESLLFPLARSLADLVCTEDFTYVKACEGPECTLLFMDRTRGRARRWCSMAICGNRAKQAAYRKRARDAVGRSR